MFYRYLFVFFFIACVSGCCPKVNLKTEELPLTQTLISIEGSIAELKKHLNESKHGMYLSEATVTLDLSTSDKYENQVTVDLSKVVAVSGITASTALGGSHSHTNEIQKGNTISLKFKSVFDWNIDQISAWNQLYVVDAPSLREVLGANSTILPENIGNRIGNPLQSATVKQNSGSTPSAEVKEAK